MQIDITEKNAFTCICGYFLKKCSDKYKCDIYWEFGKEKNNDSLKNHYSQLFSQLSLMQSVGYTTFLHPCKDFPMDYLSLFMRVWIFSINFINCKMCISCKCIYRLSIIIVFQALIHLLIKLYYVIFYIQSYATYR